MTSDRVAQQSRRAVVRLMLLALSTGAGFAGTKGRAQASNSLLAEPIKTDSGLISGIAIGAPGNDVLAFKGIPYAAPPMGELRWRLPQPVAAWNEIRKCDRFGDVAPQSASVLFPEIQQMRMSENCLTLNVLTPTTDAEAKLPVMVWLHPGGLDSGTGNLAAYNSAVLARHGVAVVTVNHRLGVLGLLAGPELSAESPEGASGNYGMLDLVAALQWVRRNIAAFGGDPNRVTIFGQDGGGEKVVWLLASPMAKGLFQRAILEAGTGRSFDDGNNRVDTEEQAYVQSESFMARVGATSLAELRAMPWQKIVNAMPAADVVEPPGKELRLHRTIDAWSLTDHPINIFDEALGSDVPVLVGGDAGETGVFQGYTTDWLPALLHRTSSIYVYRFTHVPANWMRAGLAAPAGLEIGYQFGVPGETWPIPKGYPADRGVGQDDDKVAEITMRAWVNFAASGNPSVAGLINWPAFKPVAGQDRYVTIDIKPKIQSGFMAAFKPTDRSE